MSNAFQRGILAVYGIMSHFITNYVLFIPRQSIKLFSASGSYDLQNVSWKFAVKNSGGFQAILIDSRLTPLSWNSDRSSVLEKLSVGKLLFCWTVRYFTTLSQKVGTPPPLLISVFIESPLYGHRLYLLAVHIGSLNRNLADD